MSEYVYRQENESEKWKMRIKLRTIETNKKE